MKLSQKLSIIYQTYPEDGGRQLWLLNILPPKRKRCLNSLRP